MSIYQNQGASCVTCLWQEGALKREINSVYRCKKCMKSKNGENRPGWDPKPNVDVNYFNGVGKGGRTVLIRKVIQ